MDGQREIRSQLLTHDAEIGDCSEPSISLKWQLTVHHLKGLFRSVLTRNIGGVIVIRTSDGEVEVEVLEVKGNQVRLGTKAPASVKI